MMILLEGSTGKWERERKEMGGKAKKNILASFIARKKFDCSISEEIRWSKVTSNDRRLKGSDESSTF